MTSLDRKKYRYLLVFMSNYSFPTPPLFSRILLDIFLLEQRNITQSSVYHCFDHLWGGQNTIYLAESMKNRSSEGTLKFGQYTVWVHILGIWCP